MLLLLHELLRGLWYELLVYSSMDYAELVAASYGVSLTPTPLNIMFL